MVDILPGPEKNFNTSVSGDPPDPWSVCVNFARRSKDDEIKSLKDEIDNVLIFAGLFSGVVTAFTLESYRSVKGDPGQASVLLLQTIALQLENATNPQPGTSINLRPQIEIRQSNRQINVLWSVSLVLSLSTATIGLLCLQWIREYGSSANLPNREDLAVRHIRSEGMARWRVPTVVALLPLCLVISLLLFFAGFIQLLWDINERAAIPVSVVAAICAFFFAVTTFTPGIQSLIITLHPGYRPSQSPWKSPQSYVVFRVFSGIPRLLRPIFMRGSKNPASHLPVFAELSVWKKYDWLFLNHGPSSARTMHFLNSLGWVATMSSQCRDLTNAISCCLRSLETKDIGEALRARGDGVRAEAINRIFEIIATNYGAAKIHLEVLEGLDRALDGIQPRLSPVAAAKGLEILTQAKEFIHSEVLAHLSETLEHGHTSMTLLRLRLDLFLSAHEGEWEQSMPVIGCPVRQENVAFLDQEEHDRILRCIESILKKNLKCGQSHMDAVFTVIKEMLGVGKQPSNTRLALVKGILEEILLWIEKSESPPSPSDGPDNPAEDRLRKASVLSALILFCPPENKEMLAVLEPFLGELVKRAKPGVDGIKFLVNSAFRLENSG